MPWNSFTTTKICTAYLGTENIQVFISLKMKHRGTAVVEIIDTWLNKYWYLGDGIFYPWIYWNCNWNNQSQLKGLFDSSPLMIYVKLLQKESAYYIFVEVYLIIFVLTVHSCLCLYYKVSCTVCLDLDNDIWNWNKKA